MKKFVTILLFVVLFVCLALGQTTILQETFDTNGNGSRYITNTPEFSDGSTDYFLRTSLNSGQINGSIDFPGKTPNDFFFAVQDVDGEGGPLPGILDFIAIPISGYSALSFSVSIAEDDASDGDEDWDTSDNVFFQYQIDGNGYSPLIHVESIPDGDAFNSVPAVDINLDGDGDGPIITSTFTPIVASIPGTGAMLDIRIVFNLNAGDEDIAIDDLLITGDWTLPVSLSSFTATPNNGSVLVEWTTESEVNNLGFNLYKSESKDGEFAQLNTTIIEGAGNSTTKNDYTFTDTEVVPGKIYYYQIEDVAFDGKTEKHDIISMTMDEHVDAVANTFQLMPAYPNPFNPEAHIRFQIPEESTISINVFDLRGQLVKSLVSESKTAGNYEVKWNGTDNNNNNVGNGIYFYQMTSSTGFTQTQKVMFLK